MHASFASLAAGPTLLMFGTGKLVYVNNELRMDSWISFQTEPLVFVKAFIFVFMRLFVCFQVRVRAPLVWLIILTHHCNQPTCVATSKSSYKLFELLRQQLVRVLQARIEEYVDDLSKSPGSHGVV